MELLNVLLIKKIQNFNELEKIQLETVIKNKWKSCKSIKRNN